MESKEESAAAAAAASFASLVVLRLRPMVWVEGDDANSAARRLGGAEDTSCGKSSCIASELPQGQVARVCEPWYVFANRTFPHDFARNVSLQLIVRLKKRQQSIRMNGDLWMSMTSGSTLINSGMMSTNEVCRGTSKKKTLFLSVSDVWAHSFPACGIRDRAELTGSSRHAQGLPCSHSRASKHRVSQAAIKVLLLLALAPRIG